MTNPKLAKKTTSVHVKVFKFVRVDNMQRFLWLLVVLVAIARHNKGFPTLLCVVSHQERHQDWVENMFNDAGATRNETLKSFRIYKTVEVNSEDKRISNDDLARLGLSRLSWWWDRCKQVVVIVDAYSLIGDHGRNPLTKYQDWSGTQKFLTHPRSKVAIVNATCELMAMGVVYDAEDRKLEKEKCLQGSRQKYFEKFCGQYSHLIPKTTPVIDIPPAALLPPGVAILDLFFTDNHTDNHNKVARHNKGFPTLLCVASHQERHQDWVENMFNDAGATRNETLESFRIYKTVEVYSEEVWISDDDLSVLGSARCNQVVVIIDAWSLVTGRNPLTRDKDRTGTRQFLTHPRSKVAIVNATCELMAMGIVSNAEDRKLEKETCLQGSRQKYFEKFCGQYSHLIPQTTPVVDIPPVELLPTGVAILDLLFTDNHVPVK